MLPELTVARDAWPLRAPFRISRGVKTEAETVRVELRRGGFVGRGEGTPYARYGEGVDQVLGQLADLAPAFARGEPDAALLARLDAGAARNALDCALWDLRAREAGRSVAALIGLQVPSRLACAVTISLDEPEAMAAAARAVAASPILKVKLDDREVEARIRAVGEAAPEARLILDPNESWSLELLRDLQPFLARFRVALIEQPLPAAADCGLAGFRAVAPLCADESVHTCEELATLGDRYQAVNIKLDKAGGLTEAAALLRAARELGLGVMTGCMVCSSLGIAPALLLAGASDLADLDGPWWLSRDWAAGVAMENGWMRPPTPEFWGG